MIELSRVFWHVARPLLLTLFLLARGRVAVDLLRGGQLPPPRRPRLHQADRQPQQGQIYFQVNNSVVCPNSGHPVQTSSFTKYNFLQVKNNFATIVNGMSVLKVFSLRMVIYYFRYMPIQHLHTCNILKWQSLGRVSEVRAHYPIR